MVYNGCFYLIILSILLVCLVGFKKYIWFISIGYGLSISIIGIMNIILFHNNLDFFMLLSNIILILYGFRLGGYLLYRELKTSYNKQMKNEIKDGNDMNIYLKISLWVSCTLLYFMMCFPIIFRSANSGKSDIMLIIGIIISIIGIIIETISDFQKNNSKKENPDKFVSSGLFKIVRCPNYLGELIIWTGIFVTSFTALNSVFQWTISIIGYVSIVYIMFSGARRLEIRQDKNYGDDKKYIFYKTHTPIILPFIPLYSVKKYKWLVG